MTNNLSNWQLIESAPKDGTMFLAYCPYVKGLATAWWTKSQIGFSGYFETNAAYTSRKFTHWMPLPELPKEEVKND